MNTTDTPVSGNAMELVERLRTDAYAPRFTSIGAADLMLQAADEIERLRSQGGAPEGWRHAMRCALICLEANQEIKNPKWDRSASSGSPIGLLRAMLSAVPSPPSPQAGTLPEQIGKSFPEAGNTFPDPERSANPANVALHDPDRDPEHLRTEHEIDPQQRQDLIDAVANAHIGVRMFEVDALALLKLIGMDPQEADDLLTAQREEAGQP